MKTATLLLILIFIIIESNQLFFPLVSRPLCIIIEQQAQKQVYFYYEVIGDEPTNVRVDFKSLSGKAHPPSLHGYKGQAKYIDHNMNVCMTSTDDKYKSISIDYYTQDVQHLVQLAKKSHFYELHDKLMGVGTKIKDVNRREIFEQQRQSIQGRIIEEQESSLKTLVFVKLTIIILVAAAQLYLLKTMLSKSNNAYQPV